MMIVCWRSFATGATECEFDSSTPNKRIRDLKNKTGGFTMTLECRKGRHIANFEVGDVITRLENVKHLAPGGGFRGERLVYLGYVNNCVARLDWSEESQQKKGDL